MLMAIQYPTNPLNTFNIRTLYTFMTIKKIVACYFLFCDS